MKTKKEQLLYESVKKKVSKLWESYRLKKTKNKEKNKKLLEKTKQKISATWVTYKDKKENIKISRGKSKPTLRKLKSTDIRTFKLPFKKLLIDNYKTVDDFILREVKKDKEKKIRYFQPVVRFTVKGDKTNKFLSDILSRFKVQNELNRNESPFLILVEKWLQKKYSPDILVNKLFMNVLYEKA